MDTREDRVVNDAVAGDPEAWDRLFRRYQLPLYVYAVELVHDEQQARDIVQETFVNAVRHVRGLRDRGRFGSWLFSIAHQKCLQHWRRQQRLAAVFAPVDETAWPDAPDRAETPLEWLVRAEDEERFLRALGGLPEAQRAAVLLHFLEGFSLEEIARITGTQLGTVKSRLHYAKQALRRTLSQDNP